MSSATRKKACSSSTIHPSAADWKYSSGVSGRARRREVVSTTEMPRLSLPPRVLWLRFYSRRVSRDSQQRVSLATRRKAGVIDTYIAEPHQSRLGQAILQAVVRQVLDEKREDFLKFLAVGGHGVGRLAHFGSIGCACIQGHSGTSKGSGGMRHTVLRPREGYKYSVQCYEERLSAMLHQFCLQGAWSRGRASRLATARTPGRLEEAGAESCARACKPSSLAARRRGCRAITNEFPFPRRDYDERNSTRP